MADHHDHSPNWAGRMQRLNDQGRLITQVGEGDLARLLSLRGDEDVLDLGSGTGFYTDRVAALTTGLVYALEIAPELLAHYQERGLPANVRLVRGDMTALFRAGVAPDARDSENSGSTTLVPSMVDVAVTIATWHEIDGRLDVPGVARLLRPEGRLTVVDWRKDSESWENGPPADVRYSTDEVVAALASHFSITAVENVGASMFAITARPI